MIVEQLQTIPLPEFVRLPASGTRCPVSGLNRTALDKLTRAQPDNDFRPPVRSRILKARGATRGIRLVETRSLLDYIRSLPNGTEVRDAD